MKKYLVQNRFWTIYHILLKDRNGSSMPLVMLVALVVMLIGGAVAYNTVQMHSIVTRETNDQLAYFAAESALERSMCNLDSYIEKADFASSRGIEYTGETVFLDMIIAALNNDSLALGEINNNYNPIDVYGSSTLNGASVDIEYSWDGSTFENIGTKQIRFPVTIKATANLENGLLRSYGRTAVATREYVVRMPDRFELLGAVYTLGDLVAKDTGVADTVDANIVGDTYVFGTGSEKSNNMKMYYNGGICADGNAQLDIDGNVFTMGLVRAGLFSEEYSPTSDSCTISVNRDIVAQGIQVFGSRDYIFCNRDAYTFDDIEMNGPDSIIAIRGNYFGLSPGDDMRHDTSSAVINVAPQYSTEDGYKKSRIVINDGAYINGTTYRIKDSTTGTVGHQMEDASLGWVGSKTVYQTNKIPPEVEKTSDYIAGLKSSAVNGYSILMQVGWNNINTWTGWPAWRDEIITKASVESNTITNKPSKIRGYCNVGMSVNNDIYFVNPSSDDSSNEIEKPASLTCNISSSVEALNATYWNEFLTCESYEDPWITYMDSHEGMTAGLERMRNILLDQTQVFASKVYPSGYLKDDETTHYLDYSFTPGLHGRTEFMTIAHELDQLGTSDYILKYDAASSDDEVDVVDALNKTTFIDSEPVGSPDGNPDKLITDYYFLILNYNPNKELIVSDEMNGIIFSMGKVTFKSGGKLNGSVIAAGKGYDSSSKVAGSAADYEDAVAQTTRLPRVDATNNSNFTNWDYAAVVFTEGGGTVDFLSDPDTAPAAGRAALLNKFDSQGINLYGIF